MRISLLFVLLCCQAHLMAQTLSGVVRDGQGQALPGATILLTDSGKGTAADIDGKFQLLNLKDGKYKLRVSAIGFDPKETVIEVVNGNVSPLRVQLTESSTSLEEVVVTGKSEATLIREQAYAVSVVEAKKLKNSSADVNQILNRVSGINIRQNGGMGSNFNLSLNGLSGNRVRTFINGIPMDYFGSSLSLNNFPANLISSIEIYKGAVPIHLSSDALGGSINIVTDSRPVNFLDVSYSLGSFNTHIAAINGQWHEPKTGLTFRVKSFYNHSDNDYPIDIRLLDEESGKLDDNYSEVTRFHDAYDSRMIWAEGGLMDKSWADELMIGVVFSDNYKELQQDPFATGTSSFPVGEATNQSDIKIVNFSYRKKNLGIRNLNVRSYVVYSDANQEKTDISTYKYSWDGSFIEDAHPTTGELGRKSHFFLNRKNVLANLNAEYEINPHHNVSLNYSLNRLELVGSDEFQPQNNTQFSTPNTMNKQVMGAAYTNKALDDRLSTTIFAKQYFYHLQSNNSSYSEDEINSFDTRNNKTGFGLASTFFIHPGLQIKASYERANRFPESLEMYGDGVSTIPNPELIPEISDNYNLGVRINSSKAKLNGYVAEVNLFVRNSQDYIRFEPRMNRSYYVNDKSVLASGVDLAFNYSWREKLNIGLGGTYLDLRNNDEESALYQDRLPNEPFLFGNLIISYSVQNVFSQANQLTLMNINRYVHDFYLKWPSVASQGKSTIPSRLTNDIQLTYSAQNGRYNLSFLVSNVLDAKVMDNFNQQNPGRSFNLKLRYFLSNNP
ncbi:TonB-dependent receptor [Reichenbachiella ulvae]|uniref:Carboxypeptidase-like regulatory domain-containing protein n=1 Tax=Reichenbachiella ulvae TaxID=2980104 RepID=A0ABT3CRD6_9BACT|nr:TonB-dependent receptor [Reichenbachiella ulvae]MCV9386131.1 carboxypeptidase-like regulatory domain-containing protein [Reichenbachiella ulvae]